MSGQNGEQFSYLNQHAMAGTCRNRIGWPWWNGSARSIRTIMDFPAQANGSAMMQLAVIMATEAGLRMAVTVHDGLMIVSPEDRLERDTATMCRIMELAGQVLLGVPVRVEVDQMVRWPDRFDPDPKRAKSIWDTWELVNRELERVGGHHDQPSVAKTQTGVGAVSGQCRETPHAIGSIL